MRCYIADFGLATLTDSGSGTTLAGNAVMGTPKWLAPDPSWRSWTIPMPLIFTPLHWSVMKQVAFLFTSGIPSNAVSQLCPGVFGTSSVWGCSTQRPSRPSRKRGKTIPPCRWLELALWVEHGDGRYYSRLLWAQDQMKRPSDNKVVERSQLNFIFLRAQIGNSFAILYSASHGFVYRHEQFRIGGYYSQWLYMPQAL